MHIPEVCLLKAHASGDGITVERLLKLLVLHHHMLFSAPQKERGGRQARATVLNTLTTLLRLAADEEYALLWDDALPKGQKKADRYVPNSVAASSRD